MISNIRRLERLSVIDRNNLAFKVTYYCLSNCRYALISVTLDKKLQINKRYAIKSSLISVTENIFSHLYKCNEKGPTIFN